MSTLNSDLYTSSQTANTMPEATGLQSDVFVKAGTEFLVNSATANDQFDPVVVALAGGGFVAIWTDYSHNEPDSSSSAVRGQLFTADGSAFDDEFLVNTITQGYQSDADATALAGGGFVVTWTDTSGSGGDRSLGAVRAQMFGAEANKLGDEFLVNSTTLRAQNEPAVTALNDGGFVIVWTDNSRSGGDSSAQAVRGQLFSSDGQVSGDEFLVNSTTSNIQRDSSVTALVEGGFVVLWTDESKTGGDTEYFSVRGQQFMDDGSPLGTEFLVNSTTAGRQHEASITALTKGGFVAIWTDESSSGGDTSGFAVRGQVFLADGTKVGGEFLVNTTTTSTQRKPAVTALDEGGFVVLWQDHSEAGNDAYAVRGQRFGDDGRFIDDEFLVNSTSAGDQFEATVTVLSDGGFVALWTDGSNSGDDTSGKAVRGQLFKLGTTSEVEITEDTVLTGQLTATDADGDSLTYSLADGGAPAHGTLVLNADGSFTYTPAAHYFGSDSFSYTVSDGQGGVVQGSLSLTISPVNDVPVVSEFVSLPPVDEDSSLSFSTADLLINASDADGDNLSVTQLSLADVTQGVLTDNGDGTYSFSPAAHFNGEVLFNYQVSDGTETVDATASLPVNPVNDAPALIVGDTAFIFRMREPTEDGSESTSFWAYSPAANRAWKIATPNEGGAFSMARGYTEFAGKLYFPGDDAVTGNELWSYDPFTQESQQVADLVVGEGDANPGNFTELAGQLYFTARDEDHSSSLWRLDSATDQAQKVLDFQSGNESAHSLSVFNGKLYFQDSSDAAGNELWSYDPANNSLQMVVDLNPGSPDSTPVSLTGMNGIIYFMADHAVVGKELWAYDPSAPSIQLLTDLNAGAGDSLSRILGVIDNTLYFSADNGSAGIELWAYDSAQNSVLFVGDINPGSGSSNPGEFSSFVLDNRLYFGANGGSGEEPWVYDPEVNTLQMLGDIPGSGDANTRFITDQNGIVYFTATTWWGNGESNELWSYDPVTGALTQVSDLSPSGSSPIDPNDFPTDPNNFDFNYFVAQQPLIYTEGSEAVSAVVVLSLNDIDDAQMASASITISEGFTAGDVLAVDTADTGISARYDATSGVLTLSGPGSLAQYQQLLQSVTYQGGQNPTALSDSRTLSFSVTDADTDGTGAQTTTASSVINIQARSEALAELQPGYLIKEGAEFLVNTDTAGDQTAPTVTALSGGGFVALWTDANPASGDGEGSAITGQLFADDGTLLGEAFQVNSSSASNQEAPTVTALAEGGFVALWTDWSQTGEDADSTAVRGQLFTADGTRQGSEFLVNTTTAGYQSTATVTAQADGGFVALWMDWSENATLGTNVMGQRFTADGSKTGDEFLIDNASEGNQDGPTVTGLSDGGFVALWQDYSLAGQDTEGSAVRAQMFMADGSLLGDVFQVNTSTAGYQSEPVVTALSEGGFVAVWEDWSASGGDTEGSAIRGQIFDAAGGQLGSELLINSSTAGYQFTPAVVGLSDGGFVVSWKDLNPSGVDGVGSALRAQAFGADGSMTGGEFVLSTTVAGDQQMPSLSALDNGGVIALWQDESGTGGDTDGSAVRAQMFMPAAALEVTQDEVLSGHLNATGAGINSLVYQLTADGQPDNGTLVLAQDGAFTYTPTQGFEGEDSFTYEVRESGNGVLEHTVFLTVNAFIVPNALPEISGPVVLPAIDEEGSISFSSDALLANASDANGDALNVTQLTLTDNSQGTLIEHTDGTYSFTPVADFNGELTFNYQVSDGTAAVAATATLTVNPVNDAPEVIRHQTELFVKAGDEFLVNSSTNSYQHSPVVTVLSDGNFVVLWSDNSQTGGDTSFYAVRGQLFAADGSAVNDEFLVNSTTANNQSSPSVTALDNGGFVALWINDPANPDVPSIRGQLFDADARPVNEEFVLDILGIPKLTTLSGGGFVATWAQVNEEDGAADIHGQVFAADATPLGEAFQVNSIVTNNQTEPAVTALTTGGFAVLWTDWSQSEDDTSSYAVRGQTFAADGSQTGDEFLVNSTTPGGQTEPSVSALANGGFVAVWTDYSQSGDDPHAQAVHGQLFAADGSKVADEFLVNTTVTSSQYKPAVAGLSDGGFIALWQDSSFTGADNSNQAVRAQQFAADGTPVGEEFLVNSTTKGYQGAPVVAELADGSVVALWEDRSQTGGDTSESSIRGQLLQLTLPADAEAVEDTPLTGQLVASDMDGDSLSYALAQDGEPAHGTLLLNADGSYTYNPEPDFVGNDSFTYQVSDGQGGVTLASVSLTVSGVNDAPALIVGDTAFIFRMREPTEDGSESTSFWAYSPAANRAWKIATPNEGGAFSMARGYTEFAGKLYFPGDDAVTGNELWSYDPFTQESQQVADLVVGEGDANPGNFTELAGQLYFTARDEDHSSSLWRLDSATDQAQKVLDFQSGNESAHSLSVFNGKLYFQDSSDAAGNELWSYDPANNSLQMVVDLNPGSPDSTPVSLTGMNGIIYFMADHAVVGKELWAYDPSAPSIQLLTDLNAGAGDSLSRILGVIDNTLYFSADNGSAGIELWAYDSAQNSVLFVGDINPGSGSSNPGEFSSFVLDNRLYFGANGGSGEEPWVYDPEVNTLQMLGDIPGSGDANTRFITDQNGIVYFTATTWWGNGESNELWSYDPVTGALTQVSDLSPSGSSPIDPNDFPTDPNNFDFNYFVAQQPLIYTEGSEAVSAVVVLSLNDIDDAQMASASITISEGFTAGDVLAVDTADTGISARYDATSGVLTLSGPGSLAQYQQLLQSVTYQGGQNPTALSDSRTLSFSVTDADTDGTGAQTTTASSVINIQARSEALAELQPGYLIKEGAEFLVNTDTAGDQTAPTVTALSGGGFVALWTDANPASGDGEGSAITGQLFADDGTLLGEAFQVNSSSASNQEAPTVTALAEGGFVALWTDWSQTGEDADSTAVRGQLFTADGTRQGSEFLVNTTTAGYQSTATVTAQADGGFVALWMDWSENATLGTNVMGQRFAADGSKTGDEFIISNLSAGNQEGPAITALANGSFVALWQDYSLTGPDQDSSAVRGQLFDSMGNKSGAELQINTSTAGYQSEPTVAALDTGGFIAVWEDWSATGGDTEGTAIRGQQFDAQGIKVGEELLVNSTTASFQFTPSVVAQPGGGFVVAWMDLNAAGIGGQGKLVRAQAFDTDGTKTGGEFILSTTTSDDQQTPVLSALNDGRVLALWEDSSASGGDTEGLAVRGQLFVAANALETTENSVLTGHLNDTGARSDSLIYQLSADGQPENGTLELNAEGGFTYTPDPDYNGVDSFTYEVRESGNGVIQNTLYITVNIDNEVPQISAPVTLPAIDEDSSLSFSTADLLVNASDADGDVLSVTGLTLADTDQGVLTNQGDGTYSFSPAADFNGEVQFNYQVTDGTDTVDSTVSLLVNPVNDAPEIQPLQTEAFFKTGDELLVSSNLRGEWLAHPQVTALADGSFVSIWMDYKNTSDDNSGYSIRGQLFMADGSLSGEEFLVNSTTVNSQQDPAISALSDGGFVAVWQDDSESNGDSSGAAVRGQRFTADATRSGEEFLINSTTSNFQYEPAVTGLSDGGFVALWRDTSQSGEDTSYDAVRGQRFAADGSPSGTEFLVNSTIYSHQAQPSVDSLSGGGFVAVWWDWSPGDSTSMMTAVRGQLYEADGSRLGEEFLVSSIAAGVSHSDLVVTTLADDGFVVTWRDNNHKADGDDGSGLVVRGQLFSADGAKINNEFQVNTTTAGNQSGPSVTALTDGGFMTLWHDNSQSGEDVSGYAVRGQRFSADGSLNGPELLINSTTTGNQLLPAVAALNDGGLVAFWKDADQGASAIRAQLFETEVTEGLITFEDGVLAGQLTATDADDDSLTYSLVAGGEPAHGTLVLNTDGSFTYTPAANYFGSDSFSYTVSDGQGVVQGSLPLIISSVNDAPVVSAPVTLSAIAEDSSLSFSTADLLINARDTDGDVLNVTGLTLADTAQGALTNQGDGTYSFSPTADFNGDVQFNYQVTDGTDTVATTASLLVNPINDAPVVSAPVTLSAITEESTAFFSASDLLANSHDADGDNLNVSQVRLADATRGVLTDQGDGTYSFSPTADFNGDVQFNYRISDGTDTVDTTASLLVNPANDAPVVSAPVTLSAIAEDSSLSFSTADLLINARDTDGDVLNVTGLTLADTAQGALTNQGDGTYSFSPTADFNGDVQFNYQVTDGTDTVATTASLLVNPVNDAPEIEYLRTETLSKTGAEFLVNSTTESYQHSAAVTALTGGGFVVLWSDYSQSGEDTSVYAVRGQRFAADGSAVDSEFMVNTTTTGNQSAPAVSALEDGGFIAMWSDASSGYVVAQRFTENATPVNGEFIVNESLSNGQGQPEVAGLSDGGFVAVWSEVGEELGIADVRAQVFAADGSLTGGEILVNSITADQQSVPAVTALTNGNFVVLWADNSQSGGAVGEFEIMGQLFSAGGSKINEAFQVNNTVTYLQNDPVVTSLADGGFVALWTDYSTSDDDPHGHAVRGQVFNADGSESGGEFLVNTTLSGSQSDPSVTALSDGSFIAFWQDLSFTGEDTSSYAVRGQRFMSDGSKAGEEFLANSTTTGAQLEPVVTELSGGRIVVLWEDRSQTGDDTSESAIRGQLFNLDITQGGKITEGETLTGQLTATDADGDSLIYGLSDGGAPVHGALELNSEGGFTYTPEQDFVGMDSFVYEVSDGKGGLIRDTLNIDVQKDMTDTSVTFDLAGSIAYWSDNSQKISATDITLRENGEPVSVLVSEEDGSFNFSGLNSEAAYELEMEHPSPVSEDYVAAVSAADASTAARLAVGLIEGSNEYQKMAADVDGNGVISAADASMIARQAVGLIQLDGWQFVSALTETEQAQLADDPSRASNEVFPAPAPDVVFNEGQTAYDYVGILLGDVDGSWTAELEELNNV
ncbi:MAG: tandem-95 repeat protein [Pontibacterium sp.]